MVFRGTRWLALGLLAGGVLAGGCEERRATEARSLLQHMDAIDPDSPPAERRPHVEALKELPFRSESVDKARKTCLRAHQALLAAEDRQARAEQALASATRDAKPGEERLEPKKAADIANRIQGSNEALRRARELLPKCQRRITELSSRYGEKER